MASILDQLHETPAPPQPPVADFTRIAAALNKIAAAGFVISLLPGDKVLVSPRTKLNAAQVAWITANKADIVAYLQRQANSDVEALKTAFGATVEKITIGVAPPPEIASEPLPVRCMDCSHGRLSLPGDELGACRLCEVTINGKRLTGHFGYQKHYCEHFEHA
jgi:hypothetical protein